MCPDELPVDHACGQRGEVRMAPAVVADRAHGGQRARRGRVGGGEGPGHEERGGHPLGAQRRQDRGGALAARPTVEGQRDDPARGRESGEDDAPQRGRQGGGRGRPRRGRPRRGRRARRGGRPGRRGPRRGGGVVVGRAPVLGAVVRGAEVLGVVASADGGLEVEDAASGPWPPHAARASSATAADAVHPDLMASSSGGTGPLRQCPRSRRRLAPVARSPPEWDSSRAHGVHVPGGDVMTFLGA